MKLIALVLLLSISNNSFSNVFSGTEENEAYANIMALYAEYVESKLGNENLKEEEKFELRILLDGVTKEYERTEVNEKRLFMNLDFQLMCSQLNAAEYNNLKIIRKLQNVDKPRIKRKVLRSNRISGNKIKMRSTEKRISLIKIVRDKYCGPVW